MTHIVRADQEHQDSGVKALQFLALAQTPEHMLGAIPIDAEVGGLERLERFFPDFLATSFPALGDGVTQEENVHVSLLAPLAESGMPFQPRIILPGDRL